MNNYDKELKDAINSYSKLLFKVSLDLVKNKEEAENIVQDSFLSYYKKLDSYINLSSDSKRRILARIAINKSKDYLKSMKVKLNDDSFTEEDFNLIPSNMKVEEELIKKEKKENIIRMINELKNPYKDLIINYYINDYSLDELETITGNKKSVIKVQLVRAKDSLRKILEGGELDE